MAAGTGLIFIAFLCGVFAGNLVNFAVLRAAGVKARRPFMVLTAAVTFAAAAARFGTSIRTLQLCLLFLVLLALALIDLDTMCLPDVLLFAGCMLWAVFLPFEEAPLRNMIHGVLDALILGGGLLAVTLICSSIWKRDCLGGGDIKLFAMLGLYLEPSRGLMLVLLACVASLLFALCRSVKKQPFPFGPAIAAAAAAVLLFGPQAV